jgi:hypothetical protein
MNSENTDNCPDCGAPARELRRGGATNWGWECGTAPFRPPVRSLLCREREKNRKLTEENVRISHKLLDVLITAIRESGYIPIAMVDDALDMLERIEKDNRET